MAIRRCPEYGPYFGEGALGADEDDFNEEENCVSISEDEETVYKI